MIRFDPAALALAAYRVAPTREAHDALIAADAAARANEDPDNRMGQMVFPPGRVALTVEDTVGQLWTRGAPEWCGRSCCRRA
jgi:hypothetical protein